ncbi:MAG: hypothetical protein AAF865_17245 [Pseudomonadota bacterium]
MRPNSTPNDGLVETRPSAPSEAERRRALVREMVLGAVLPGLIARKDQGVFDRGPNVLRLPDRSLAD